MGARTHSKVTTKPGDFRSAQVDDKKIKFWDDYFFKGDGQKIEWGNISAGSSTDGGAVQN